MRMFGASNDMSVTEEVESATNEKSVEEDWSVIMSICDKAGKSSDEAKHYLRAITKRLNNSDPHVGVKAVTLLDACVKNSGKVFHIELASREFENDFTKLMTKGHSTVAKKLRESLKRWAENEFKADDQLNLIPSLYAKLKHSGYDFSSTDAPVKKLAPLSKDPDVVDSQEEEEQIIKAIELSLKETGGSPRSSTNQSSLYPSMSMAAATASVPNPTPAKELRKVRALYDFEAAEDNELTFSSGEIIFVIDDSDPNWWKGSNQRGEGLFPANFVTPDLSVEPEKFLYEKAKKMVQFKETTEVKNIKDEPAEEIEINEDKIDRLLHLLHEADPTNPERDTEEMLNLEREVNGMGPLIDTELERVDRKHAQLTQLSADLVEALGLYHTLMREPQFPPVNKIPYGYPVPSTPMAFPPGSLPLNVHPSMMNPNQGMPPGHDRPPFMHPGGPPVMQQQYPSMPMTNSSHMPPAGILPPGQGMPPSLPPHLHQHENPMGHYPPPGMQGYGMPNMGQPNFPPPGSVSQTNLQNGPPQQGPHFAPSNSHVTQ